MVKIFSAFILVLAILLIFFFSSVFKIKNVKINSSCAGTSVEDLVKDKNIFTINSQQISSDIITKFPCVQKVEIKKQYPQTLEIIIFEKEAILQVEGSNYIISEDGYVSDKKTEANLPKIFMPEDIKIAPNTKLTDKSVLFCLNLMKKITKSDFNAVNIRILDSIDVAVYSNDSAVTLFSQKKDINKQVDSLQSVLAKAKIDATKIAKIDLRFDKPIITLK